MANGFLVFLGGGIGALARYWLSGLTYRALGSGFPWGTFGVNVIGCLLIGICMSVFNERALISPAVRIFLTIGILGGFTTFSSFSYETIALLRDGEMLFASLNVLFSVATCLGATFAGSVMGRYI